MTPKKTAPGIAARLGILAVSALFALSFGGGGLFSGLLPLVQTVQTAWEVRTWQSVPAEVLSSELLYSHGSERTTYRVQARYRYSAQGQLHESNQIGLDAEFGADNIGRWHRQWHARLSEAQKSSQQVTAWVDPDDPSRAVLDREIRWEMVVFQLPFALVFPAVGVAALWVFWRTLMWRDERPDDVLLERRALGAGDTLAAVDEGSRVPSSAGRGLALLWFFTFFWCGISFPMTALMWMTSNEWWPRVFVSIFAVIGVFLLMLTWRQSVLAWRFAGTRLRFAPVRPLAGSPFEVELALSRRASRQAPAASRRLRVAQYRVDDSGSGTQERQVEAFDLAISASPDPTGGERWFARIELPADAPTHGGRRSGERVDWRLEILKPDGSVEVAYDVPVQERRGAEAGVASTPPDRFAQRPSWPHELAIALRSGESIAGDGPLPLPAGVQAFERPDAWELQFAQTGWRWASALAVLPLGVLVALWWRAAPAAGWLDALESVVWWGAALLLLGSMHMGTRQWHLRVRDDGLEREVASWVWRSSRVVSLACLDRMFSKLVHAHTTQGITTAYYALHIREMANGPAVRLTPGLRGEASPVAVARALQAASAHRNGRFTPGGLRVAAAVPWRPLVGWLMWLVLLSLLTGLPVLVPWPG